MFIKFVLTVILLISFTIFIGCSDDENPISEPDRGTTITDYSSGNIIEYRLGGDASYQGIDIIQASDNSFIVFGKRNDDFYLARISNAGELVWEKAFGGPGTESPQKVEFSADNNLILCGSTSSIGDTNDYDFYLAKFNMDGEMIWEKTFDNMDDDYCNDMTIVSDGYVLCGSTEDPTNEDDYYIVKTDLSGTLVWEKTFGTTGLQRASDIVSLSNGGYIVIGYSQIIPLIRWDLYILKLDGNGNQVDDLLYGADSTVYFMREIIPTNDGNFVLVGDQYWEDNLTAIKMDESFNFIWELVHTGTAIAEPFDIIENPNGTFAITGDYNGFYSGGFGGYLVELNSDGSVLANYGDTAYQEGDVTSVTATNDNKYAIIGRVIGEYGWEILIIVI
jgi:hypothetical protein